MDREKTILQHAFIVRKIAMKNFLTMSLQFRRLSKSADVSEMYRKTGNALYTKKPHDYHVHMHIFQNYCKAILSAPDPSEHLALGYGNRSAFLLHISKYEDCIKDIDRAVKISKSNTLKIKLLCRKAECLKKLGLLSEEESVLKEAHEYVNGVESKNKKMYYSLIERVKTMSVEVNSSLEREKTIVETKNVTDCIKIGYNKELGRHLIAKKDYAPGDVIFVEKTYATYVNPRMSFTNCDFCLKTAWSGIPCAHCDWTIFCSEECRDKATDLYHDVECSLIPFLKKSVSKVNEKIKLSIRVVIIAVKEAGSISELMNNLKIVDACTDLSSKGFYKDGKFNSNTIESIYSLYNGYHEPDSTYDQASIVLMILIGLATHTKLLNKSGFTNIDNIIKCNELMFLGSLIMKLIDIRRNSNDALYGNYEICERGSSISQCWDNSCCTRGVFMASLTNLINHSCFPNAMRCFTNNQRIIIHAIHPIKKNEQITMAYYCTFYKYTLRERTENMKVHNILKCFCQPCKENWPPLLSMPKEFLDEIGLGMKSELEKKLYGSCLRILATFEMNNMVKNKFAYIKETDLEDLSKAITEVFLFLKQPSYLTCLLVETLGKMFSYIYGLKPRHFGTCDSYEFTNIDHFV